MFFQIVFVSLLLIVFGVVVSLAGFRLFVVLLPIFGFLAGFLVTAESIQQLFGGGFLATVTSWVFALVVGLFFAVLSYLFYYAAVVILAATVGYELGVGIMVGLGIGLGLLQFIVGLVVALALIAAVVLFNLPRLFIVIFTAIAGAGMILSGILLALGRIALNDLQWGVVGAFVRDSLLWSLVFLAIIAVGIAAQLALPDRYMIEPYGQDDVYRHAAGQTRPAA